MLPTPTSVEVMLYQGMRDLGVTKTELARRLGWHLPQVDRVLDLLHRSWLDRLDAVHRAVGRRLHVSSAEALSPAAATFAEFNGIDSGKPVVAHGNNLTQFGKGIDRQWQ